MDRFLQKFGVVCMWPLLIKQKLYRLTDEQYRSSQNSVLKFRTHDSHINIAKKNILMGETCHLSQVKIFAGIFFSSFYHFKIIFLCFYSWQQYLSYHFKELEIKKI